MKRCPVCNSSEGLSFGCLKERCDIYLFTDNIEEEFCKGEGCWCCETCDYVSERDYMEEDDSDIGDYVFRPSLYDEIKDNYDVDDYVLTDNIDWSGEKD
jgi:hypothetical protein